MTDPRDIVARVLAAVANGDRNAAEAPRGSASA
jgi:hypothetical protein